MPHDYSAWDSEENYAGYLRMSVEQHIKNGDDREFTKRVPTSCASIIVSAPGLPPMSACLLDVLIAYRDRLCDLSPKALARLAVALAIYE